MLRTFNKLLSLIAGTLMLATVSAKADVVVASAGFQQKQQQRQL